MVVARLPPKMIASTATPSGSSHSEARLAQAPSLTVKRALGWAAKSARIFVEGLPLPVGETVRGSLSSCPPTTHRPQAVVATLVNTVCEDSMSMAMGLVPGTGARCDTKESGFRVNGPKASVCCQVRARRCHHPGFLPVHPGRGGLHHRKVCLATGAGESRNNPVRLALRAGDFHQQHVLRHPAFFSRRALKRFAERRLSWEVERCRHTRNQTTKFLWSRGSGKYIWSHCRARRYRLSPSCKRCSDGVEAFHPGGPLRNTGEHFGLNPNHHVQAENDVGGVGDLNTKSCHWGVERSHRETERRRGCDRAWRPGLVPEAFRAWRSGLPSCWWVPHPARSCEQMNVRDSTRATSVGSLRAR
jgi:hypothetical protein